MDDKKGGTSSGSSTAKPSKGDQALKADQISTAIKKDKEKLKKLLAPMSEQKTDLENLIKSMSERLPSQNAYFKGADSHGTKIGTPHGHNQATHEPVNAALKTLHETLEGKQSKLPKEVNKSLAPIVTMLKDMVKALETLEKHILKARG